jgi:hypothetical protein
MRPLKSGIIHICLLMLLLFGCTSEESVQETEVAEIPYETAASGSLELPDLDVLISAEVLETNLLLNWQPIENYWESVVDESSELSKTARNYLQIEDGRLIVEQTDSSLVVYEIATDTARALFIEEQGDLAGPKQADFSQERNEIVFTRIVENSFTLCTMKFLTGSGSEYETLFTSNDPIITPLYTKDSNLCYFGVYSLDTRTSSLFQHNFDINETKRVAFIPGELQQLALVDDTDSLYALSFEGMAGTIWKKTGDEWQQIWSDENSIGDSIAFTQSGSLIVIPLTDQNEVKSILFFDQETNQQATLPMTLEAQNIKPIRVSLR